HRSREVPESNAVGAALRKPRPIWTEARRSSSTTGEGSDRAAVRHTIDGNEIRCAHCERLSIRAEPAEAPSHACKRERQMQLPCTCLPQFEAAFQRGHAGGQIIWIDATVLSCGKQPSPVRAERHHVDADVVRHKRLQQSACGAIPNAYIPSAVSAGGGELFVAADRSRVSGSPKKARVGACADMPPPDSCAGKVPRRLG